MIDGKVTPGTVFAVFWAVLGGAMRLGQALPQVGIIISAKLAAGDIFRIIDLASLFDENMTYYQFFKLKKRSFRKNRPIILSLITVLPERMQKYCYLLTSHK